MSCFFRLESTSAVKLCLLRAVLDYCYVWQRVITRWRFFFFDKRLDQRMGGTADMQKMELQ